ncbi:hypothetical protein [Citrobacter sp. Cpo040]|uniref:hypothetical protein n=1 Tax=Citrobacter sp. Cpo040 TaxID=2985126 RepID=UPI0025771BA6|nr:hypothetical protein [Citrobacter sp. Cpo040]MDM2876349.1 hypothetical protein [Citrobacter sp. Cpo040]
MDDMIVDSVEFTPEMFMGGFADEAPREVVVDDISDLKIPKVNKENEEGIVDIVDGEWEDFNNDFDSIIDETSIEYNSNEGELFGSLDADKYVVGDKEFAREDIEKALNHYEVLSDVLSSYDAMIVDVNQWADNEIRPALYAAMSDNEAEIAYYKKIIESTSDQSQFYEASRILKSLESRKTDNQRAFMDIQKRVDAKKNDIRTRKMSAVKGEMFSKYGWTEQDLSDVAGFAKESHNVVLDKPEYIDLISPGFLTMMKEAMLYRKGQKATSEKTESIVQKALSGKPTRASSRPSPNFDAARNKARAMAKNNELSTKDMFNFLVD